MDIRPTMLHLYAVDQLSGFAGSLGPLKSTMRDWALVGIGALAVGPGVIAFSLSISGGLVDFVK